MIRWKKKSQWLDTIGANVRQLGLHSNDGEYDFKKIKLIFIFAVVYQNSILQEILVNILVLS